LAVAQAAFSALSFRILSASASGRMRPTTYLKRSLKLRDHPIAGNARIHTLESETSVMQRRAVERRSRAGQLRRSSSSIGFGMRSE
jgi:hypothetical protein